MLVSPCFGQSRTKEPLTFGHDLLHKEFLLNYTNFNHGSFGACPRKVLEYQTSLRLQQEQQPDTWMRVHYRQLLNGTREKIANYVNADSPDNIVLVESASTAVNSILRSYPWQPSDIILYFSVAYGMVKNTAAYLVEEEGVEVVEVPITWPIQGGQEKSAFLDPLQVALNELKAKSKLDKLRLVVLDHIVSVPAVREPIAECAELIKSYQPDCFVLVDGAHAMGQVRSLDLQKMGPHMDAYVSNGHKWLYSPKGSAFLWVNSTVVTDTFPEPTVISSANSCRQQPAPSLIGRFEYVSTRDYTATVAMSKSLEFRDSLGGDEAIYEYTNGLAMKAKHHLIQKWNVTSLAPDSMEDFMINIG